MPIYLLNSSIGNFFTMVAYFLEWTSESDGSLKAIQQFRDTLLLQDCIPKEELLPFWMNLIDATLDSDPMNLGICVSTRSA